MVTKDVAQEEPALTELAFSRLLEWLDDGVDSRGETYLEMRRRLVAFFERRNRPTAEDLADETLNRVGRTLLEDGVIATRPPARYCYTVAKFVLLEDFRHDRRRLRFDDTVHSGDMMAGGAWNIEAQEGGEIQEQRLACLERCLQSLDADQRALLVEYYRHARHQKVESRREMAKRLGITMNALAIRLYRVRAGLEVSLETCLKRRRQA